MSASELSGAWKVAARTARAMLGEGENPVYSPACILEGLRAMRLGAFGRTASELDALIGGQPSGKDRYGIGTDPGGRHAWAYDVYAAGVVAGVWIDDGAAPAEGFEASCASADVSVAFADLSDPRAGERLSRWVAERTEGLLEPEVGVDPEALACVVSALYPKDAWEDGFYDWLTEGGPFHAEEGDVQADYMTSEDLLRVADLDFGTVVSKPFSNGASMLLVLPREGADARAVVGDPGALARLAGFDGAETDVELHLPKFTCETTGVDMCRALVQAGFESAAAPDLRLMTGSPASPTSYVHGAKVTIEEAGMEAGAYFVGAVAAGMPPEGWEPPVPRVIVLDRPFAFVVVSRTGQPLFVGVVTRP